MAYSQLVTTKSSKEAVLILGKDYPRKIQEVALNYTIKMAAIP